MSYRPGDTPLRQFRHAVDRQRVRRCRCHADCLYAATEPPMGAVTVSVAHNATGDYTASALIPLTYSGGDDIELLISATVGGVAGKAVLALGKLDRTAQAVAQVVHRSPKVHFVSAAGNSAHDGFSPETAKALPTQPTPGPGETILVFSGTFALNTAPLDLSGDGTTGVHLIGAAMGATILTSNVLLADGYTIVKPGNGSNISDLTIQGIAAGGMSTNQYQAPLGAAVDQTPFIGAVVQNVQLIGDSDGIYVYTPGNRTTLFAYDCVIQTKYDGVNLLGSADSRCELHDCQITVAGPSTCNAGITARGPRFRAAARSRCSAAPCPPPTPRPPPAPSKPPTAAWPISITSK